MYVMSVSHNWLGPVGLNLLRLDSPDYVMFRLLWLTPAYFPIYPLYFLAVGGHPGLSRDLRGHPPGSVRGTLGGYPSYLAGDFCIYQNVSWFFSIIPERVWTSHNTAGPCSDSFPCLFYVLPASSSFCSLQSFFLKRRWLR